MASLHTDGDRSKPGEDLERERESNSDNYVQKQNHFIHLFISVSRKETSLAQIEFTYNEDDPKFFLFEGG